tara:strand:+ start:4009 stop:4410 length:402 start_codon:yes stop_codon:yes gene_type:complete
MSINFDVKEFINDFQQAWSTQSADQILTFFADELNFEDIPIGLHAKNKEELREILNITFEGVPNFTMEVFEHYVGDDFLITKWKQSGNMTVQGYGLDLKDHAYEVVTTSIIKFDNSGNIISVSDNWNTGIFYQ